MFYKFNSLLWNQINYIRFNQKEIIYLIINNSILFNNKQNNKIIQIKILIIYMRLKNKRNYKINKYKLNRNINRNIMIKNFN